MAIITKKQQLSRLVVMLAISSTDDWAHKQGVRAHTLQATSNWWSS